MILSGKRGRWMNGVREENLRKKERKEKHEEKEIWEESKLRKDKG